MNEIKNYLELEPSIQKAVVAYAISGSTVLLGLRKTSSTNLGIQRIAGIGGKNDSNESNEQALLREVEEEVGIIPTTYTEVGSVIFLNPNNPKWNLDVAVYIINSWKGEPKPTNEIDPVWFNIDQIPYERMFSDNQHWLPQVLAGKNVNAVFLFGETGIVEKQITFGER